MMRTGHSSEKGVRTYKWASDQLLEEMSDADIAHLLNFSSTCIYLYFKKLLRVYTCIYFFSVMHFCVSTSIFS